MNWKSSVLKVFVGVPLFIIGQVILIPSVFENSDKVIDLGLTNIGAFFFGFAILFIAIGVLMFSDGIFKNEAEAESEKR